MWMVATELINKSENAVLDLRNVTWSAIYA